MFSRAIFGFSRCTWPKIALPPPPPPILASKGRIYSKIVFKKTGIIKLVGTEEISKSLSYSVLELSKHRLRISRYVKSASGGRTGLYRFRKLGA